MGIVSGDTSVRRRIQPLLWLIGIYLVIGLLSRSVLLAMAGPGVPHHPELLARIYGIGLGYDLITSLYLAWPLLLYLWLMPTGQPRVATLRQWLLWLASLALAALLIIGLARLGLHASAHDALPLLAPLLFVLPIPALAYRRRSGQIAIHLLSGLLLATILFVAISEFVFWGEFSTRFNFIAVDYLVYTTEVIGNIRESYPLGRWLLCMVAATLWLLWLSRKALSTAGDATPWRWRMALVAIWAVLTGLSLATINAGNKDHSGNAYVDALAGNGIYQFFAAFRSSHLDYDRFYATLPGQEAWQRVRQGLQTPDAEYLGTDPHDLTRLIRNPAPERHLNVVLISVESLSADYLGAFGASHGALTPHLDALAGQSLFFTRVYANGTRTVRGLEALSLSVPPTPGDSIIKEAHNENLFSLAGIFNHRGYRSEFVYGGYGYFDNMNDFFSHNGYAAVDRTAIPASMTIHGENVWGVADEDLYSLALRQMDGIHARGQPFFLHIMTTTNHRPFTFPAGRVAQRNGTREGTIAYTDWSIDDFLRRARRRPWFDDTVFVITADHDASSAGRASIPLNRYHIPLWIYAPKYIRPARIDRLMSQIDIPPTLLGLLHFSYRSRFFGRDLFQTPAGREQIFPGTYEKLGYSRGQVLSITEPGRRIEQFRADFEHGEALSLHPQDQELARTTMAYYQVASEMFKQGGMRHIPADDLPVPPRAGGSASTPAVAASTARP
ncbi:LTA synthase family protein [Frateuria aurantia]|uniref:Phosphoglycerol transferase family protein, alkaline phosphatase superfamily n=1 Tax=Frateuria aurantia (strain ATCC 33424 / DSM 6220 / KCTC 2777 / LMG 1558 / NBRC 3245 / NCIMB 13370) TaxID=767434 RepID=H8KZK0_FRAAD|nr:LTA synthase family protein [Frateuria aurantia]AFC87060.1 phosphoglycerol transferase family protein, alkaline phosphatase superfamily [Frateuria aurantia DSM 6220]